VGEMDIVKAI